MWLSTTIQEWKNDPVLARAMDIIMILHMDHEQNASTSTVRNAGSSQVRLCFPFRSAVGGAKALVAFLLLRPKVLV